MPGKRNMRFHPRPKARGFPAPESYQRTQGVSEGVEEGGNFLLSRA